MQQPPTSRQSITISLQQVFGGNQFWRDLPEKQLALLHQNEPITDELLWSINPKWKPIEAFTRKEKNRLLRDAIYPKNLNYAVGKTLMALIICSGANPDKTEGLTGYRYNALWRATSEQDTHFTEYLLKKGANPNHQYPGQYSHCLLKPETTFPLARLLISCGAEIPKGILDVCCERLNSASLLQLYIDHGAQALPNSCGDNALQILASREPSFGDRKKRLKMAKILLKTPIDIAHQNKDGNTVLHLEAGPNSKTPLDCAYQIRSLDFTLLVINHYLQNHEGFLTFLWYLRQNFPILRAQHGLLHNYFGKSTLHIDELRHLLSIRNNNGDTAYDLWPIDELNPATCTYAHLTELMQKALK